MLDIKKLLKNLLNNSYKTESGGIWTWRKYADGTFDMWGKWDGSLSSYATWNSNFNGYYKAFTFATGMAPIDSDYQVFASWQIGNGYVFQGNPMYNKSTSGFSAYAMSNVSGSQSCVVNLYVHGRWKSSS